MGVLVGFRKKGEGACLRMWLGDCPFCVWVLWRAGFGVEVEWILLGETGGQMTLEREIEDDQSCKEKSLFFVYVSCRYVQERSFTHQKVTQN